MLGGQIIGALFFVLVLFAALTSSISLAETVVSIIVDKLHINRKLAIGIVFVFSELLGLVSCLGFNVWGNVKLLGQDDLLSFFDYLSNSIIMPIVAFLTCIVIGYIIKPKAISDEIELNGKFNGKKLFEIMIKFIAPICLVLILLSSLGVFGKL
jgi:NSS family neurotransmitter:Na+ symporter